MTEFSLVIRNARIVDGTGQPSFGGDVAIDGEHIAAVGSFRGRGAAEIDAGGKVLAPGFIDVHTHYDPQLCWDGTASPTPEHGVTSLVMGNCSVSLAPVRSHDKDRLIRWFGSVEDMEGELLNKTISFEWESFEEYLSHLRGRIAPNVGALVGHAALRIYAMGEDAQKRIATPAEVAKMAAILRQALEAGAFGLSVTFNHVDDAGCELPCRYAERTEWAALFEEVAAAGRIVEMAPNFRDGADPLQDIDLFASLALETGATCTISPILHIPSRGDEWLRMLARLQEWRDKGAPAFAQTQVRPLDVSVVLAKGTIMFSRTPLWRQIMEEPVPSRIGMLRDPANRDQLAEEALVNDGITRGLIVKRAWASSSQPYLGRQIGDIADAEDRRPTDVLIDIALADDLETEFSLSNVVHADPNIVATLLHNPAVHIGSGDAGAHVTGFSGVGDTCYLFEKYVRAEKRMTLEQAVKRLTSDISRDWNIPGRGLIRTGLFADLVLFDPDTIARGPELWVEDLPGKGGRFVRHAVGIDKVIVNGTIVVQDGRYTDEKPGRLI
jgi:N-acyl-D-aspartate/D-glutamate deacylase